VGKNGFKQVENRLAGGGQVLRQLHISCTIMPLLLLKASLLLWSSDW